MLREPAAERLRRAQLYAASSRADMAAGEPRIGPAYQSAFFAAELAGKALLLEAVAWDRKTHEIGLPLYDHGLLPVALDPGATAKFFQTGSRARYDFRTELTAAHAERALYIAERLIEAAERYPDHPFHPARLRD